MSLPDHYNNTKQYLTDLCGFLNEFKWIFTVSNTQFIQHEILDCIPLSWIEHFRKLSNDEFNTLTDGLVKPEWPDDLISFFQRINNLRPKYEEIQINSNKMSVQSIKGVNPKKLHEIEKLSLKIHEICAPANLSTFVDVGCGLGYLTQILNTKYVEYKILGIESDPERVKSARNRQEKYFPSSIGKVHFVEHFVNNDSMAFIDEMVDQLFPESTVGPEIGLIGMHACADLTVASIKLFLEMDRIRKIIIMPCCYHKMSIQETIGCSPIFNNIPLSDELHDVLMKITDGSQLINRPFLRLASQQTASRWKIQSAEEHVIHGKNMFERSLVNSILGHNQTAVRTTRGKIEVLDFESISRQYTIFKYDGDIRVAISWNDEHRTKYEQYAEKYSNGGEFSEILTALQTCIQSLCENLVLLDKVCYINEMALKVRKPIKLYTEKVVADSLSPRCFALIGEKL